jgi:hypothetical protein
MLVDATLTTAMNAVSTAITHIQMHSGGAPTAPGFATNAAPGVGRLALTSTGSSKTVDGDGDLTIVAVFPDGHFTGGTVFTGVSYWGAATGGTALGGVVGAPTGDTAANAAGAFTITVTETMAST